MYNGIFNACDMDGTILKGKDRGAVAKKDFIHITGSITYEYFDEDFGKHQHIFVTRTKEDSLDFCNEKCFKAWIEAKVELYQQRKDRYLKENATDEWLRSSTG